MADQVYSEHSANTEGDELFLLIDIFGDVSWSLCAIFVCELYKSIFEIHWRIDFEPECHFFFDSFQDSRENIVKSAVVNTEDDDTVHLAHACWRVEWDDVFEFASQVSRKEKLGFVIVFMHQNLVSPAV